MAQVCFESDSLLLIKALNGSYDNISYFGMIINDYKSLANEIIGCRFSYARRSANRVAHALAKAASFLFDLGS